MEVWIGTQFFKTKKSLLEKLRKMLHEAPMGVELDEPHHSFLVELLKRHPEREKKAGVGIRAFRVTTSEYKNRCFEILRTDGSTTDFSFMKCVTEKSDWGEFMGALREAVGRQIWEAKEKIFLWDEEIKCPLSGEMITREMAHVDHIHPVTFEFLAEAFAQVEKLDHQNLPMGPSVDGQAGRRLTDPGLEVRWQEFHEKNAKLRVISEVEHKKLKKKQAVS